MTASWRGGELRNAGLRFQNDAGHHRHSLARIAAAGSFCREHHTIRAIKNRIRHVTRFCPRRSRVLGHGLEHLGCRYDRSAPDARALNYQFLDDRHPLGRKLHAQVATRNHDTVGYLQNSFETLDGLWLFQLGDDGHGFSEFAHQSFCFADVIGGANEGQRNRIHSLLQTEFEIPLVFVGEHGDCYRRSRQIDPLMLSDGAPVQHFAFHVPGANRAHSEFNSSVGQKHP